MNETRENAVDCEIRIQCVCSCHICSTIKKKKAESGSEAVWLLGDLEELDGWKGHVRRGF